MQILRDAQRRLSCTQILFWTFSAIAFKRLTEPQGRMFEATAHKNRIKEKKQRRIKGRKDFWVHKPCTARSHPSMWYVDLPALRPTWQQWGRDTFSSQYEKCRPHQVIPSPGSCFTLYLLSFLLIHHLEHARKHENVSSKYKLVPGFCLGLFSKTFLNFWTASTHGAMCRGVDK